MLSSITPLGERGRQRSWRRTATAYLLGSLVAGAALGALLGGAGALVDAAFDVPPGVVAGIVAVVCLLGVVLDLRLGGLRLPTVHRQVDENWLGTYRGWVIGAGFGAQLGLGVVTIVTTSAIYVTLALAVLTGSVLGGLAVGGTFGLVRALPILAVRRVHAPADLVTLHRRVSDWAPHVARAALATQVALGLGALAALAALA